MWFIVGFVVAAFEYDIDLLGPAVDGDGVESWLADGRVLLSSRTICLLLQVCYFKPSWKCVEMKGFSIEQRKRVGEILNFTLCLECIWKLYQPYKTRSCNI